MQRDLDEQGIGDLIEDDTEEANFQAVYNYVCYAGNYQTIGGFKKSL